MARISGIQMTNLGPKVDIGAVFGGAVSYAALGAAFHVNPYDILLELRLAHGTNEKAFEEIYKIFLAERPWLTSYTDRKMRIDQYWASAHGGTSSIAKYNLPFLNWQIDSKIVIRLPKSAKTAPLISADADSASRYIKFAVDHPDFSRLELIASELHDLAEDLSTHLDNLEQSMRKRAADSLTYLTSAQRLLVMMYRAIPNTPEAVEAHHVHEHVELIEELQHILHEGVRLASTNRQLFDWYEHEKIENLTREILATLSDKDCIQYIEALSTYYDVAEQRDVWTRFESALLLAGNMILRSEYGENFVEEHLMPFLGAMADGADVTKLAAKMRGTPLERGILDQWRQLVPKNHASIFATLGRIGSIGAGAVGNSRGPASLAVSLVTGGGPLVARYLALQSLSVDASGTPATAFCLRLLMRVANISDDVDLDNLVAGIMPDNRSKVDLTFIRKIDWSTKLMSGNLWVAGYALANLAVFLSVMSSDQDITLERFAQALQSATQAAVPLAELGDAIVKRAGGSSGTSFALVTASTLARVAGYLAIGLALWTVTKEIAELIEEKSYDMSDIISIASSASTVTAVGTWLFMSSLSVTTAAALVFYGGLISMALVVASIGYEAATRGPGTATYVRVCIDSFKASEAGKKLLEDKKFSKSVVAFDKHLDQVKEHLVSFAGKQDELYTLFQYFSVDGCATIVEMKPDVVREILGVD